MTETTIAPESVMSLTTEAMAARVRMLAIEGMGDHEIAHLMGLHVAYVRQILAGSVPAQHAAMP